MLCRLAGSELAEVSFSNCSVKIPNTCLKIINKERVCVF